DALRRQIQAPDQSDSMRGSNHPLAPGEPIWIQTGKSRIVHFGSSVRRVSLSDPELASIVVLGPTTLLVNAKVPETPPPPPNPGYSIGAAEMGTISSTTLTTPPQVKETSLVVWDQSGLPSSHTIFIAPFIDRQVMLEVTVAEINRTSLEQHGIDIRQA